VQRENLNVEKKDVILLPIKVVKKNKRIFNVR